MGNKPVFSSIKQLVDQLAPEKTGDFVINEDMADPNEARLAVEYHELIKSNELPVGAFIYAYGFFSNAIEKLFANYNDFENYSNITVQFYDLMEIFGEDFPKELNSLLETAESVQAKTNLQALLNIMNKNPEKIWPILKSAYKDVVLVKLDNERIRSQVNAVIGDNPKEDDVKDPNFCDSLQIELFLEDLRQSVLKGSRENKVTN